MSYALSVPARFASGPRSRKAQAFRRSFEQRGIELSIPELDRGDFAHLTISGQLNLVNELLAGESARLIGSSMGATWPRCTLPHIPRLIASSCWLRRSIFIPLGGSHWPREARSVARYGVAGGFHYGQQTIERVQFDLFGDARKHAPIPDSGSRAYLSWNSR